MIRISDLHYGDKVRIVSKWNKHGTQNSAGRMDKWLGQIMTVDRIHTDYGYVSMREDCGEREAGDAEEGWAWFPDLIDCVVSEAKIDTASDADLMEFIGI